MVLPFLSVRIFIIGSLTAFRLKSGDLICQSIHLNLINHNPVHPGSRHIHLIDKIQMILCKDRNIPIRYVLQMQSDICKVISGLFFKTLLTFLHSVHLAFEFIHSAFESIHSTFEFIHSHSKSSDLRQNSFQYLSVCHQFHLLYSPYRSFVCD